MNCAQCGTPIPDGAVACPACGTQVAAVAQQSGAAYPVFQQVTYVPDNSIYKSNAPIYNPNGAGYQNTPVAPSWQANGAYPTTTAIPTAQNTAQAEPAAAPTANAEATAPAGETAQNAAEGATQTAAGQYDAQAAYDYSQQYAASGYDQNQQYSASGYDQNQQYSASGYDQNQQYANGYDYSQQYASGYNYSQQYAAYGYDYSQQYAAYGYDYTQQYAAYGYDPNQAYAATGYDPNQPYGAAGYAAAGYNPNQAYTYDPNTGAYVYNNGDPNAAAEAQKKQKKKKLPKDQRPLSMKWYKFLIYFHFFFFAVVHVIYSVFLLVGGFPLVVGKILDKVRAMDVFVEDGLLFDGLNDILGEIFAPMKTIFLVLAILSLVGAVFAIVERILLAKKKKPAPAMFFVFCVLRILVKVVANGLAVSMFVNGLISYFDTVPYENLIHMAPFLLMIPSALLTLLVILLDIPYFSKRRTVFGFPEKPKKEKKNKKKKGENAEEAATTAEPDAQAPVDPTTAPAEPAFDPAEVTQTAANLSGES